MTGFISGALFLAAIVTAVADLIIYYALICPRVSKHSWLTKIICPYFILDEFKKGLAENPANKRIRDAHRTCFFLPLGFVIASLWFSRV